MKRKKRLTELGRAVVAVVMLTFATWLSIELVLWAWDQDVKREVINVK